MSQQNRDDEAVARRASLMSEQEARAFTRDLRLACATIALLAIGLAAWLVLGSDSWVL